MWKRLLDRNCHPELAKFLCSLYAPVCLSHGNLKVPSDKQNLRIKPCKQLCEQVRDGTGNGEACGSVSNLYSTFPNVSHLFEMV